MIRWGAEGGSSGVRHVSLALTWLAAVSIGAAGAWGAVGGELVSHGSFELGEAVPQGWELANGEGTAFSRDASVAHVGRSSGRMDISAKGAAEYPAFKFFIPGVRCGQEYFATVWARTDHMTDLGAYVVLEFFKGAQRLNFVQGAFTGPGTHGWKELTCTATVPEDADAMRLALVAHGSGRVWFDDASLIRTLDPPPEFTGDRVRLRIRSDRVVCEGFLGFGAHGDFFLTRDFNVRRGVTPADIERVTQRVRAMRPHVMRVFFDYKWWEPEEGCQTPDSAGMKDLLYWVRFLKEIGTTVLLCPWGDDFAYSPWMRSAGKRLPLPEKAEGMIRSLVDAIEFLRRRQGLTNVGWVNLMNEPDNDGARYPSVDEFVRLNRLLHAQLEQRGLRKEIRLLGVDGSSWQPTRSGEWFYEVVTRGQEYLDGVTSHTYGHKHTASLVPWIGSRRGLLSGSKGYGGRPVPFLITEFSTYGDTWRNPENHTFEHGLFLADFAVTALREGTACLLVWCLFDTYYSDQDAMCQEYGLWRYKTKNWEPRPGFYSWSLITRYTRPGSRVVLVEGEPSTQSLRSVGLIDPENRLTLLVVNRYRRPLKVTLDPGANRKADLAVYRYTSDSVARAGEQMIGSPETLRWGGSADVSVEIPAQAFLLLTEAR